MHLFVDISSHGLGHLAITAPVLNALAKRKPDIRLTVRSGVSAEKLAERIGHPFDLIAEASDFGFIMHNALTVDYAASAAAYREAHADWDRRVEREAAFLADLAPQLVFSNVSYLPLAGAARAGIRALALCSLNWADLFAYHFGQEPWAQSIHAEILAAYRSTSAFLRTTPGMPMSDLSNVHRVGPIAALGRRQSLGLAPGERAVLIALGGIAHRLPIEKWPVIPGVRWLVPEAWRVVHPASQALESFAMPFTDLLCSVDAVVTKPGYGTFAEAACNGIPVLYQRREGWPEQDALIEWLHAHARCAEVDAATLATGRLAEALDAVISQVQKTLPQPTGVGEVLCHLLNGAAWAG